MKSCEYTTNHMIYKKDLEKNKNYSLILVKLIYQIAIT